MRSAPALAVVVVAACGGSKEATMPSSWADFDCRDRVASYFVVGSMAAAEAGVQLDCNVAGPRVLRWTVDKDGTRVEDSGNVTPGEFDDVWKRIEGVGWRHLDDCPPDLDEGAPVYTFDVKYLDEGATFQCESLRPVYPWNTLVDELDQLAARIQGTRGKNTLEIDDSDLDAPSP